MLAAVGLSPQVVTETVYALYRSGGRKALPTEVHVLSTSTGIDHARYALLGKNRWFARLLEDHELPPITFTDTHLHLIEGADGAALDDIRRRGDNEAVADATLRFVRRFTEDEHCAVHASIAGGRKTMGFLLGYAMMLCARPQDRLSHVLVSAPFESSPDFFYPLPGLQIQTRDRVLRDAGDAEVMLADIPLLSLRGRLPTALGRNDAGLAETIEALNLAVGPPRLRIELGTGRVVAGGTAFRLPPKPLAMLSVFARRTLAANPPLAAPAGDDQPDAEWGARLLAERRLVSGEAAYLKAATRYARGMTRNELSEELSVLNGTLRQQLGSAAAAYLVHDGGCRPRRYSLAIAAEHITLLAPGQESPGR